MNNIPAVGAIAWWAGSRNHVAYVEAFDSTTITTSEDRWGTGAEGPFSWKTRSVNDPDGYIHFKDVSVAFSVVLGPGDFSGDGKPDLLAISTDGGLSRYRGDGLGGFTGSGENIGSGWNTFKTVLGPADFDGDGGGDLLGIRANGDVVFYHHTAAGFRSPYPVIATGFGDYKSVLGPVDFDGDGKSDLLTVSTDGVISLRAGNGLGGFLSTAATPVLSAAGIDFAAFASILTPADFDGDGNADILALSIDGTLSFFRGDGLGGLVSPVASVIDTGWDRNKRVLNPADFDGDGNTDILTVDFNGNLVLHSGDGGGGFISLVDEVASGWEDFAIALNPADVDSDGKRDLLTISRDGVLHSAAGNGTGGLLNGTEVAIASGFENLTSVLGPADVDSDGVSDLLAIEADGTLLKFRGDGANGFLTEDPVEVGYGYASFKSVVGPGDFSGDGKPDLLTIATNGDLFLNRGTGTGTFLPPGAKIGNGWANFKWVLSPGDFSGDGKPDLLTIATDGTLRMYRGNGVGGFDTSEVIGSGWGAFEAVLAPADFSGDGKRDLIAIKTDGTRVLYRGNGAGGFTSPYPIIAGGFAALKAVLGPADVDSDGLSDLLAVEADGTLLMFRGDGANGFLTEDPVEVGSGYASFKSVVGPGDFSGDGEPDLLTIATNGDLFLNRGTGTGTFLPPGAKIGSGWASFKSVISPGDFSGDGKADLLTIATDGTLKIYRGNGAGGFGTSEVIGSGWAGFTAVLAPADIDRDGKRDLLTVATDGTLRLYRGDGASHFLSPYPVVGTQFASFARVLDPADLNGDGVFELVTVGGNGNIEVHYRGANGNYLAASGRVVGAGF